ncbi:MAG: aminopeptidase P family protein [Euryarchaeota archaeon]|nr:aminopeptidase P family protein [Euryarchaeota archaeon]
MMAPLAELDRQLRARGIQGLLCHADTERDADLLYLSGFLAPDPFTLLRARGRSLLLVSILEYGRARRESRADRVLCTRDFPVDGKPGGTPAPTVQMLAALLRRERLRRIGVPSAFPYSLGHGLERLGFRLETFDGVKGIRTVKAPREIASIRRAQRATERGMAIARRLVRRRGTTCEAVRRRVDQTLLGLGCEPGHLIVAAGPRSADPHYIGAGPIRPGDPVVCDFFPRLLEERYFADMTRTFVRGRPSPRLREMHGLVLRAQEAAIARVRAGARCRDIHQQVLDIFDEAGVRDLYIHTTGHGLGLEIHEPPRIAENDALLQAGQVVTVEPGLYDPRVGGVRIEDMVLVKRGGGENLTRFPKQLEA